MKKILYEVQPSIFPDEYSYLMLTRDEASNFASAKQVFQSELDVLVREYRWFTGNDSDDVGYNFVREHIRNTVQEANAETFSKYLSEGSRRASVTISQDVYTFLENESKRTREKVTLGDVTTEQYYKEYFEIKKTGGLFELGAPELKEMLFYAKARTWPLVVTGAYESKIQSINVTNVKVNDGQDWEITLSVQSWIEGIRGPVSYECYIHPWDLSDLISELRPVVAQSL